MTNTNDIYNTHDIYEDKDEFSYLIIASEEFDFKSFLDGVQSTRYHVFSEVDSNVLFVLIQPKIDDSFFSNNTIQEILKKREDHIFLISTFLLWDEAVTFMLTNIYNIHDSVVLPEKTYNKQYRFALYFVKRIREKKL